MIDVQNLNFTYEKMNHPAVRDLTFAIEPGEIFGFLGPSGAGKSTTQKILIGLLREYEGMVSVFGRDLSSWGSDLYERVGVSFELPNHYLKLTARENLTYFGTLYGRPVQSPDHLLEMVGLGKEGDLLVSQYSKGMKNRLSVARALLHQPELLFLDEPTAGLDPVNARRIRDLVLEQKEAGKTIFLTTHDMLVAETLCDRVAFIIDGGIQLIGRPQELKLEYGRPTVRVEYQNGDGPSEQEFPLSDLADNPTFHDILRRQAVRTIHTQEATLDDIFVAVTGRELA
ncbi:MAG: ABC transporter ATP-binding protein [Candidatus Promineifilaceae bacterium]